MSPVVDNPNRESEATFFSEAAASLARNVKVRRRFVAHALIAALLTGCATDVANRYYGTEHFPPRSPSEVGVFQHAPACDYLVIADLQARRESVNGMKKRAAKIGADAIIVSFLGGFYAQGDQWAGQDSESNSYSHISATAIKFKGTACQ